MTTQHAQTGALLKEWRTRRRMSQLDLALEAEISQRHLSFLESGRSQPSRDMVLRLGERLGIPLRERNLLLLSAGYAPVFSERPLADPAMKAARSAVETVLRGHEPNPALAVDRHWTMAMANRAVAPLLAAVQDPALLAPPVNVLRLSLHPSGLGSHVDNFSEWRGHVLARLRQQIETTADAGLIALETELASYPVPIHARPGRGTAPGPGEAGAIAIPFRLRLGGRVLSFISTTTIFGTPIDVTLSELAVESFFPADQETADAMRQLVDAAGAPDGMQSEKAAAKARGA
jgi:transcriptional regulator with XRE-family HTH domain